MEPIQDMHSFRNPIKTYTEHTQQGRRDQGFTNLDDYRIAIAEISVAIPDSFNCYCRYVRYVR